MKKTLYIFLLFIICLIPACEQTSEPEIDIPFKSQIVIQGNLEGGNTFQGITISKTLPLDKSYNPGEAYITNASAFIKVNGSQIIPLHYVEKDIYKPLLPLTIIWGWTYELFVQIDDVTAYSKTFVPAIPAISDVQFHDDGYYLSAQTKVQQDVVYGAAWMIGNYASADDFYTIENSPAGSSLTVRTTVLPDFYKNSSSKNITSIQVYAFDKAYYDYFKTKGNGKPIDNSYIQGGGSVSWNVYGKDVIGLFIGYATSVLKKADN